MRIVLPFPVSSAVLGIFHGRGVATLTVKGLNGHVLDTRVIPRAADLQTIVVENVGPFVEIVIVILALDPLFAIASVCVRAGLGPIDGPLEAPPLVGQRSTGELLFWEAEELVDQTLPSGRRCLHVRYSSPDANGWQAIGIPALQSATVRLVGVCGLTTTLERVRTRDQEARDTLKDGWNLKAGLTAETRPLLAAGAEYKVRVAMSWAGWRPTSPGQQPPATVADSSWQGLADVEYYFRTAAEAIDTEASPPTVSLTDEKAFDPRAVARYLIGFEPENANAPPHLLDDALRADFEVDHVEQLLAAYERDLVLTLRRTDPPAGSVKDGPLPVIPLDLRRAALDAARLDRVDGRVITALRADPRCLATNVNTGGVTLSIYAELEPDAEYDLMLFAPPTGESADESLLVARTHFHSSRYADVKAMLEGLGFALDPEVAPFIPFDFVVANGATMPVSDPTASDAALEDALRTLGMDPWPVVGFGRTVAIWRPGAATGEYLLAGLLLESPEPIERGERCGVVQAAASGGTTSVLLAPSRANTAGTRVLLATTDANGTVLDPVANLTLALQMHDRHLFTRLGARVMRALPRIAYQELP